VIGAAATRGHPLLTPAQAEQLIEERLACLPIESLPLVQCAGAVLRENIYAERDQPPFDRVAMDGIALHSEAARGGARRYRVQAIQGAGDPALTLTARNSCIEVMTGAVLPTDCDAVVPVEQIKNADGEAELGADVEVEAWQNVHRRGTDSRQGALLLSTGTRLTPPEVAIAASAGMARVRVSTQPMVVVISTGNELIEPGEPILPHQIRRSNVYAIIGALRRQGFQRVADDHVLDDEAQLRERLKFHLDTHDVLVLSGGVSMGRFDLVPRVLSELGVQVIFHKVAQRPGKPLWFGVAPSGAAVFALPGNPVSTLVCLARYVIPALYAAMGQSRPPTEKMALASPVESTVPLALFMPVRVEVDDWGRAWAVPSPTNGSGDFTALAGTDGFVELPPGPNVYQKGFVTRLYRW
jgi:molybdopterin molybdotransferase